MTFMNVQLLHNGTDITEQLISYNREKYICTGIGTISIVVLDTDRVYDPWDEMVLYEEGHKKGTFYVRATRTEKGEEVLECQDKSALLIDYFVSEQTSLSYTTYARYWIEKYLNEAGVSYTITTDGNGAPLNTDMPFGLATAYEIIQNLLQLSNWYMYFNANGRCIIGSLTLQTGHPKERLTDDEILSIQYNKNDKMLRNRAVVWGGADLMNQSWVFADISVDTRWNYDSTDKRAVVLSNSTIQTYYDADRLARQMLNEFARITEEKTVGVAGEVDVELGDYVFISSHFQRGGGMITTLASSLSKSGFITTLTLDQRCPRLFGFVGNYADYVYIGTEASGVWRKELDGTTWTDYSVGLTDLGITDLSINTGVFASTTNSGLLFHKDLYSNWIPFGIDSAYFPSGAFPSGGITPSGIIPSGYYAICCTLDKYNRNIYAGYTTNSGVLGSGFRASGLMYSGATQSGDSWILSLDSNGNFLRSDKIIFTYNNILFEHVTIIDIDNNEKENVAICLAGNRLPIVATGVAFNQGYFQETLVPNTRIYAIGPPIPTGFDEFGDPVTMDSIKAESLGATDYGLGQPIITFSDEWTAYIDVSNNKIYEVRMNSTATALEETAYDISGFSAYHTEAYWTNYQLFRTDDPDVYTIGMYGIVPQIGRPDVDYFKTISVNKQTGSLSLINSGSIDLGFDGSGFNQWNLLAGELFARISIERRWDGTMAKLYYRIGAINLRTGQLFYDVDKLLEDMAVAGRLTAVAIGSPGDGFIGHTQDANGLPIISWARVGVVETEFDPITLIHREELYLYTGQIRASSLPTILGKEKHEEIRGLVSNTYYTLGIRGWKERGWDIEKKYNAWVYMLGKYLFGTFFYEDKGCTLPYLSLGTGSYMDGFTEIPLAIQNPYRSLVQIDTSTYILEKSGATTQLQIPVDSTFPAPGPYRAYNIPSDSICVDADANDGCIYGIVYKYQPGLEQYGYNYLCGWKQDGTMVKRYFTWLSGQVTDQLYVMNQYAILRYYAPAYGFRFLFIRFDEPSIFDPGLGGGSYVIKHNPNSGSIEAIYSTGSLLGVDTSKNSPTVIYNPSISGQTTSLLGISTDNTSGSFTVNATTFPILDVRTFDISNSGVFTVESGNAGNFFRYIGFVNNGGFYCIDALLTSASGIHVTTASGTTMSGATASGAVISGLTKLETSNISPTTPYFFLASPSGFWQRNPGLPDFVDYSYSLPGSTITIIRVDDRL